MANRLIFGVVEGETSPPTSSSTDGPVWMYREGETKLFNHPNDVPKSEGWVDSPNKIKPSKKK